MRAEKKTVPIQVELTEGYQERFTRAILKIYEKRIKEEKNDAA